MSKYPELSGIAAQMAEYYFEVPTPLQKPVLDWLKTNITELPTGHGDPRSRVYQQVAMNFVNSFVPSFGEKHIDDDSLTAETYRACLGMIEGLSQEVILEGLIGIERLKRQPKIEPQ